MRPTLWIPPVEPSGVESTIIKHVRRAKLFVFLRLHRHTLFDESFQTELAATYEDSPQGQPPIPPAQLAMAVILQAYTRVSDDEVIEATLMDRRWQLALDCLNTETAPFSKGTFVAFRQRLIDHHLDRRLIERTVEVAAQQQGPQPKHLRVVLLLTIISSVMQKEREAHMRVSRSFEEIACGFSRDLEQCHLSRAGRECYRIGLRQSRICSQRNL
ncbi:hypothetical protein ANRL3_02795 [Anaerolineae bacterium]|nr:hypothetical protein ANRL3_02795 [Anaerolineae bacterium]